MAKMNRERGLSNIDELESEFGSLLGRGRAENHASFPLSADESSSLNHMMNNLEEEQRTVLRHHPQASSSRLPALDQHTDHSSSATTTAPVFPSGSRFLPTDLGLVRVHLKDMVEKGKLSSFVTITTLDVYKADPWLLEHVHNDLFKRNEWYYFVPRTKRGEKAVKRTVPASGESEGGTWRSNNKKTEIKDKDNNVKGYKQNLVYNKTVKGKAEPEKTDWHMTEYCLHKKTRDDLVLCHIKLEKKVKDITELSKNGRALTYEEKGKAKIIYEDEQPSRISSILKRNKIPIRFKAQRSSPQVALKSKGQMLHGEASTEAANDFTGFANQSEEEMMLQGDHGGLFYFPSEEECMSFDIDELKNTEGDSTQQQQAFQDQDLGGSL